MNISQIFLAAITAAMVSIIIGICIVITVNELKDRYFAVDFLFSGCIVGRHFIAERDRQSLMHHIMRIRKSIHAQYEDEDLFVHIVEIDKKTYEENFKRK